MATEWCTSHGNGFPLAPTASGRQVTRFVWTVKLMLISVLLVTAALVPLVPCGAQEVDIATPAPDEQTQITREQWLERVAAAKERLRQQRAQGLGQRPATSERELDQENADRAMSDSSLQQGDIVSTPRGLMKFKGRPGQPGKPADDFVPAMR